jgi:FMN-dependent NADH-azoreductase
MLLSRKIVADLGGSIQMDLTYATIPTLDEAMFRLSRELERKYHVEDPNKPINEFINHELEMGCYEIPSNFLASIKEELKDKRVKTYNKLVDAFMEKWKEKKPPDIKVVSPNVKMDAPIKKLTEVIKSTKFVCVNQLKILEAHLASASNYIGYSDLIELELHKEHEQEFHLEIPDEPMNESVTD